MKKETIEIKDIGKVVLKRNWHARRLRISIKPFQGVQSTVPFGVSFRRAKKIIHSKRDWIVKGLGKIRKAEEEYRANPQNSISINKTKAKDELIRRLEDLAGQYGFTYKKIFIRNQKTRWGSCSAENNINLNIKLTHLEPELIDYVILHELLHTRIKNHSKHFWAELDNYVGNAKQLSKELRKHGLRLL